ncbi:uncharacterized protein LOC106093442 [Stomoxys calcitrans]|uniref:Amino acid transporter transmembrane domain-containing protein n=1 Tax=Stomoxys calcitrans TaxID=35570 RepID=A0A1I8P934_STOCA|nr:uncharacterized protein LOC106093442 [Stomoxys calcitrans]
MFKTRSSWLRPSKAYQRQPEAHDQLPFLSRTRFSALPHFRATKPHDSDENLSLFVAILYVIDMFGVLPFVTLPALLVQLGFFGIPLVISVVVLQIYTSFLLSECWTMAESLDSSIVHKSRYPYVAIANMAYGRYCGFFVTILLNLSIFAVGIPNVVMAAQNLELVGDRITDGEFKFSFCYWTIIVGVFMSPLVWLGSPKRMRGLAIFSVCVMIVIVILLWFCLFTVSPMGKRFEDVSLELPPFLTILSGYSILAFQFDIHPMLLTLQIDMQQKHQVAWAAFSGITITCTMAIVGSVIAAYKFGTMIAENVLETLPSSIPLYILLILMALQLCFSTTAASSALYLQIENYFQISEDFSVKRVLIRTTVVALQVGISEFLPSFDALMDIVGGTITGPLVFILPPLLYRRMVHLERYHQRIATEAAYGSLPLDLNYQPVEGPPPNLDRSTRLTLAAMVEICWLRTVYAFNRLQCDLSLSMGVLIFGILATFFSTYLNLFQLTELFQNNSPCFGNLTSRN